MSALLLATVSAASAADKLDIAATAEAGFARIVLRFDGRLDLPGYKVTADNGVLAITFAEPVTVSDESLNTLPADYVTTSRLDSDDRGIRFGLRTAVTLHTTEAGERLYVDLLPKSWKDAPPTIPADVVAELDRRAKEAAVQADQKKRADETARLHPVATVRVGQNPTFFRIQFDWSAPTTASFTQQNGSGKLLFGWPVPVDLYQLKADLPKVIRAAENSVSPDGSLVTLTLGKGIKPRFYQVSPTEFTLDIDMSDADIAANQNAATTAAALADAAARHESEAEAGTAALNGGAPDAPITPLITSDGDTVRISFPFERDTASAAFRRGNTLWLMFDRSAPITAPEQSEALRSIASGFTVSPAGDVQIVRVDLASQRLTTFASQGRAWVLSVGNVLLGATTPVEFKRVRGSDGDFGMAVSFTRPGQVHSFRDPVVGDLLDVVTAYPPAIGSVRAQSFVDFDALPSIHGLVLRPENPDLAISLAPSVTTIAAPGGLTLSDQESARAPDTNKSTADRASFLDLASFRENDPLAFSRRLQALSEEAATKEGPARDIARLELAQFYVGNQMAEEAIGVAGVLAPDLKTDSLKKKLDITEVIADVIAVRPKEALAILTTDGFPNEVDALLWRTIARADTDDFAGAREDALASEGAAGNYPDWVQKRFLFAAIRAALETADPVLAAHFLSAVKPLNLSLEDTTAVQLFQGWLSEMLGKPTDALDLYGQVIAADVRPTRAEAVYRTLLVLRKSGQIDLAKATATLSAEALLWRGDSLEVKMQALLAQLYFDAKSYRLGFETVRAMAEHASDSGPATSLIDEAQAQFADLFLNGGADQLSDVDALALYYDFRQLTPPGTKGDEMIRNLARRLVKVDLLAQAGDLLQYQFDNRLKAVAKAQLGAELALIRIADNKPEMALRVLHQSRMEGLPPSLDRQRRILEARALIDADRPDIAIDLLQKVTGRDVDLLRVDGYWQSKNYTAASGLIEAAYADAVPASLSPADRLEIVRAGVGMVLAGDGVGLSRLRAKFSDTLAQTPEWPMFDYITQPNASPVGDEFKQMAKEVAGLDSLGAFLQAYRQLYPDSDDLTPAHVSPKASA